MCDNNVDKILIDIFFLNEIFNYSIHGVFTLKYFLVHYIIMHVKVEIWKLLNFVKKGKVILKQKTKFFLVI